MRILLDRDEPYKLIIPEQDRKALLKQINIISNLTDKVSKLNGVNDGMGINITNFLYYPVTFKNEESGSNYYDGVGQLAFVLEAEKYLTTEDRNEKQHYRDILDTLKKAGGVLNSIEFYS